MAVTIRTLYAEVVEELLKDVLGETKHTMKVLNKITIEIVCPEDDAYPAVKAWTSDALGCGLISGVTIARF